MRRPSTLQSAGLGLCSLAAFACSAAVGTGFPDGPGSGESSGGAGGASGSDAGTGSSAAGPGAFGAGPADPAAAGPMVLRRLSQVEYLNTIRDLLGDTSTVATDVPGEPAVGSFDTFAFSQPGPIGVTEATGYQALGETLAAKIASHLSALLPCTPSAGNTATEASCASMFITTFGAKAYRRPLTMAEVTGLTGLYQTGRSTLGLDFNGAVGLLIEGMLQSPGFLYHWEQGPTPTVRDGAAIQLDGYAMANRLSYFLWASMPDTALLAAAAGGQLSTSAQVAAQATRMLQDPKAISAVQNFFEQLLQVNQLAVISKDPKVYPNWNSALQTAMDTEFRTYFSNAIISGSGTFSDLFTGTKTVANQALASVYGMTLSGTAMQPITLDPTKRAGFLTMPAFLAVNGNSNDSHPIYRGHAVYMQLLCHALTPPKNVVVPTPAPLTPGETTRQQYAAHSISACAQGCHNLMDPYGFAFEHYDGIGQYRTMDNGSPVDSATTVHVDNKDYPIADGVELAGILAKSIEAQQCFTTQWVRYALSRPDTPADAASILGAYSAFTTKTNVRDLLVAVATARTFRYRTPAAGELLP